MVKEAAKEAADFYEKWTNDLQDHILSNSNSAHPDAMPPGIREAIMLGTIQAAMMSHVSLMKPETQRWALEALKAGVANIDVTSLLGGLVH